MLVLLPTAYLPSVNYMAEAIKADEIVIEAFETYTKQTCRNHCTIFGPNGKQKLTIPVIKVNGNHTLTKDVLISAHQPWQKIHWRSIETAYNNSPFFLYYQDQIAHLYHKKFRHLLDMNTEILFIILKILNASQPVRFTQIFEKHPDYEIDLRTILGVKLSGKQTKYPGYTQVFETSHGFIPGLSILDVIFNLGPEASLYLASIHTNP
ncbi:MAG: WbqC family protein [Bacteroidales bacterium]|nr:WbqC family protein [Bacteroidales bacterium]